MLKKSNILCSCGGLQHFNPYSTSYRPPHSTRKNQTSFYQCRHFAHARDPHSMAPYPELSWPTTPTFSPYDLFKMERNAPYSKRRYYDFVKIYHPDRPCNSHPLCRDISDVVRMQRYRIIVAAHEILSDPAKRDAYDKYGLGWHQRSELFAIKSGENRNGQSARYARQRGSDESVFRNATWEDWERWHQRNDPNGSRPSTASHGTFASFLILLSILVGAAQAVTIGRYSSVVDERAREASGKRGRFLDGRKHQTVSQIDSQGALVQNFLIKRDPSGYGLKEDEEETYRCLLSPRGKFSGLNALGLEPKDGRSDSQR